jgi:hypothetical protein
MMRRPPKFCCERPLAESRFALATVLAAIVPCHALTLATVARDTYQTAGPATRRGSPRSPPDSRATAEITARERAGTRHLTRAWM